MEEVGTKEKKEKEAQEAQEAEAQEKCRCRICQAPECPECSHNSWVHNRAGKCLFHRCKHGNGEEIL